MANYPQELTQDAVCQSRTGHMTGLWFLPTRPLRLNTNECMSGQKYSSVFTPSCDQMFYLVTEHHHKDRKWHSCPSPVSVVISCVSDQTKTSYRVLYCGSAMLCHMLDAQLFLLAQYTPHREHSR